MAVSQNYRIEYISILILTLFFFAIKNLKRKPVRTAVLITAICLLVTTLIFASSFVYRVHGSIRRTSERLGADIIVVPAGSRGAAEDILLENRVKSFYMDKKIIERVRKIEGIEKLTYQTYLTTVSGVCCDVPEMMVIAFDQESDFIIRPWLKGPLKRKLKRGEAIIGSESAYNVRIGLMDVNSILFGRTFSMIGTLDKTGTGLDNALFISDENIDDIIRAGKTQLKPGKISIIFVRVKSGYDPYVVARKIEDSTIEIDTVARKDIGKRLINTLADINRIFYITALLSSILSVFLAWSVFSAVVNERSREIGIMKALGAKESHVRNLFLSEVLIIGLSGSILGLVGGISLFQFLVKSFSIFKGLSTELGFAGVLLLSLFGLLSGTAICIFGALSPLRRIGKMEPLTIIKGEL